MPFRPVKISVNDGNFGDILSASVTTTNNTATTVLSYGTPANSVTYFSCSFVGRRTDDGSGDGSVNTLTCCYKNVGGTLTQIGSDTVARPYSSTSLNTTAASSGTSGSAVLLKIASVNATTVDWILQSSFAIYSL